jgi:endonuclease III
MISAKILIINIMDLNIINQIFTIFSTLSKEPKTELEYVNNFTLTVAVILSAQATDISVNKATLKLFKNHKNPEDFLILGAFKDLAQHTVICDYRIPQQEF